MEDKLRTFALQLYDSGAFKLGSFILKSGAQSPFYIDLRLMVCSGKLHAFAVDLLHEYIIERKIHDQIICGVPYTALPIATMITCKLGSNMVIRRKEVKKYGTKNLIEGLSDKTIGQKCLVIEDIISSGASILETVTDLEAGGLVVKDAVVIINREQGGVANLEKKNLNVHALFTVTQIVDILFKEKRIEESIVKTVKDYIKTGQIPLPVSAGLNSAGSRTRMSFEKRKEFVKSAVGTTLLDIMIAKRSNLCVAADVPAADKLLEIAQLVGPHICILKTHYDAVQNFSVDTAAELQKLAKQFNFLIMEDRKFADIGNTVLAQVEKVASWADLITAHSLPGPDSIGAVKAAFDRCSSGNQKGVFLVAEMSSKDNLITSEYAKATADLSNVYPDLITGLVCQTSSVPPSPGILQLTPGVQLESGEDSRGQKYNTPDVVINQKGADIAVVGRGIILASDPAAMAEKYQSLLWQAYLNRLA